MCFSCLLSNFDIARKRRVNAYMEVFLENEENTINASTQMHYALDTAYQKTRYPQVHDFFEILMVLSGHQELIVDGAKAELSEGMIALIRPGEVHSRRYLESGLHVNVAFSAKIAQEMFAYLGSDFPKERLLNSPAPLYAILSQADMKNYRLRFDRINMIPTEDAARSRTMLRVLLLDIFTEEFSFNNHPKPRAADWFDHLLESMKNPEMLRLGAKAMTELSGKRHEHLCRVCRKRLNMTPTELINELRLAYAANLLVHSSISITEVCMEAGFDSLSHFYHLFGKKYGRPPKAFREINNNTEKE